MILRVTSDASEPWEGSLEEFLEHQELPELVRRRIENLRVGERVAFDFDTTFTVERTS